MPLWLSVAFVLSYFIHVCEETWGGFATWSQTAINSSIAEGEFLYYNLWGLLLTLFAVIITRLMGGHAFLLTVLSSTFFTNSLLHILASILSFSYSPGLISSLLLWIPLPIFTFVKLRKSMSRSKLNLASLLGLLANLIVISVLWLT
jgi:hypothetical protein